MDLNAASNLARNCLNTAAMPPSPAVTHNRIGMTALRAQLAVSSFLHPSLPPLCAADVPSLATRHRNVFLVTTQTAGPCHSSRMLNMSPTRRVTSLSGTEIKSVSTSSAQDAPCAVSQSLVARRVTTAPPPRPLSLQTQAANSSSLWKQETTRAGLAVLHPLLLSRPTPCRPLRSGRNVRSSQAGLRLSSSTLILSWPRTQIPPRL
jgi:hypothetical protein